MHRVTIYNKSNKQDDFYEHIHTIRHVDALGETQIITGDELLTHEFPTHCSYQLLSDSGNYCIDKSVIGTFEVTKTV